MLSAMYKGMFAGLLLLASGQAVFAADLPSVGAQKASILMRLTSWVDWPTEIENAKELNICLLGNFDFLNDIKKINGQVFQKKTLMIKPIGQLDEAKRGCQLLFVAHSEESKAKKIIDDLSKLPMLLVGDFEDFAKAGGSMNFTTVNTRIGVTINLESMQNAHLTLSPNAYRRITIVPEDKDLKE